MNEYIVGKQLNFDLLLPVFNIILSIVTTPYMSRNLEVENIGIISTC